MQKNVGSADRTFRIVAGLVVIAAGFYFKAWWGVIGVIPLATALLGWCPLYLPFGISTCATKKPAR